MSETQNTQAEPIVAATEGRAQAVGLRPKKRHAFAALAAIAILGAGAGGVAAAGSASRPGAAMEQVTPVKITNLSSGAMISVKGNVAEIFGNKFIIQDESGRALVETGPAGDNGKLVAANEAVTVQGRFDNGFIHANFVVRSDGTVEAVGPVGPPPPPPHGPRGPHDHAGGPDGPAPHEGPGRNDALPPPPPAPDASIAPVAPPAPDAAAAPAAPAPAAPAASTTP